MDGLPFHNGAGGGFCQEGFPIGAGAPVLPLKRGIVV
jgi:hypothetical protein